MTWRETWAAGIHAETKDLPDDMPLADRIKFVDGLKRKWPGAYDTSWGKKSWQAARRDYLVKFGYQPKTKKAQAARQPLPLFPDQ